MMHPAIYATPVGPAYVWPCFAYVWPCFASSIPSHRLVTEGRFMGIGFDPVLHGLWTMDSSHAKAPATFARVLNHLPLGGVD